MEQLFFKLPGHLEENKNLAELAAYRIGGPARYFYTPQGASDILDILRMSEKEQLPLFILGSGSNLLISDLGFDGIVLWLGPTSKDLLKEVAIVLESDTEIELRVPSHFSKAKLLDLAIEKHWSGLEFSAGIPGSLGGAVFMNAGTKWGSYGEIITRVEFVSLAKGIFTLKSDEIGFKYRGHGEGLLDGKTIVTSVFIKLKKHESSTEILKQVDEIYSYRGLRQPLELPNCGSVFKNPENSEKGAGRLIEAAGLKGFQIGDAQVSLKHANFILNKGKATAQDVKTLIEHIQKVILEKFQIHLEREVIYVGEF